MTWLMSEKVTRLTMGEPVWSWINGVFMPSGCTMLVEPISPMLPTDAFLSAAGTRFSIWLPAEDWVSRAYDASLDQRSDFWADVDAELFADLRFELFNELELDRVVDKDGMLRDASRAIVEELEGCDSADCSLLRAGLLQIRAAVDDCRTERLELEVHRGQVLAGLSAHGLRCFFVSAEADHVELQRRDFLHCRLLGRQALVESVIQVVQEKISQDICRLLALGSRQHDNRVSGCDGSDQWTEDRADWVLV